MRRPSEEAERQLDLFAAAWDSKYPTIARSWRATWERRVPLLAYPPEVRRIIYTTNTVASLNMSLRKIIRTRGSFPTDEAALKLIYPRAWQHHAAVDDAGR